MQYDTYVEAESRINRRKFARTSLTLDEVVTIARYIQRRAPNLLTGAEPMALCHGVRNGAEVRAFSRAFGCRVIGTDISRTILEVPDCVWMNFLRCPELWRAQVDFLYSNSYDHAPDLRDALIHWRDLLAPDGRLFLQFTEDHRREFGFGPEELEKILSAQGIEPLETLAVPISSGLTQTANGLYNGWRQVKKRVLGPLFPTTSRAHWAITYTLRRGPMIPTYVLVGRRAP